MKKTYIQIFLTVFLPLFLLSAGLFVYSYSLDVENQKTLNLSLDMHNIELQDSIIAGELKGLSSDVHFLASLFRDYPNDSSLPKISKQLLLFAQYSGFYDQLRFLDNSGMEQIRINYNDDYSTIVPISKLQNKSTRYYFKETIKLDKGQLYVSPLDLNVEKGVIEKPLKPVLRIAMPLYNNANEKIGIIILNYLGNRLFNKMSVSHEVSDGRLMLLNKQGYWLFGANNKVINWGFMFPDKQQMTFSQQHPEAWKAMSERKNGQIYLATGVYSWRTLSPWLYSHSDSILLDPVRQESETEDSWKIVMFRDTDFIANELLPVKKDYLNFFIYFTAFLFIISALIAYLNVRHKIEVKNRKILVEAQLFTNKLLKNALATRSLDQLMSESLESILSISWLSILAQGSIFILDEKSNELVMIAQHELSTPLITLCARLPMGKCLCGRAAETKKIIFADCLDHQHEIGFPGMTEHGHICVPILKGEKLIGVLNLYVEHGHKFNPLYEDTLTTITNVLAGIIERKQLDDELDKAHVEVKASRDLLTYERSIVEDTLLRIRSAEEFDAEGIRYLMSPVESTAGDIILSSRRPDGVRHIMLGDFTGHGLTSALAGPSVADTFYDMTKRGIFALEILTEINEKLVDKLPPQLYLAACFFEFNPATNRLSIWNAGLPEPVLFRDGKLLIRYHSGLMPLGIIKDLPLAEGEIVVNLKPGDMIYSFTDGVLEASDANGEMYGQQRLEALLTSIINDKKDLKVVIETLEDFQAGDEQTDDITLLEISI